jgi:hypothetical protein
MMRQMEQEMGHLWPLSVVKESPFRSWRVSQLLVRRQRHLAHEPGGGLGVHLSLPLPLEDQALYLEEEVMVEGSYPQEQEQEVPKLVALLLRKVLAAPEEQALWCHGNWSRRSPTSFRWAASFRRMAKGSCLRAKLCHCHSFAPKISHLQNVYEEGDLTAGGPDLLCGPTSATAVW